MIALSLTQETEYSAVISSKSNKTIINDKPIPAYHHHMYYQKCLLSGSLRTLYPERSLSIRCRILGIRPIQYVHMSMVTQLSSSTDTDSDTVAVTQTQVK